MTLKSSLPQNHEKNHGGSRFDRVVKRALQAQDTLQNPDTLDLVALRERRSVRAGRAFNQYMLNGIESERWRDRYNGAVLRAQGNLFTVKARRTTAAVPVAGGLRGTIAGFSRASRLRLLKLSASLDYAKSSTTPIQFLTLTYHDDYPSPIDTKKHIKILFDRLRRRAGWAGASMIWRLEFQRRGAPHFHIMIFNAPYMWSREYVRDADGVALVGSDGKLALSPDCWLGIWQDIVGDRTITQIKNEKILHDGWRHVLSYVSKYTAKMADAESLPQAPSHWCGNCKTQTLLEIVTLDGLHSCKNCGSVGTVAPAPTDFFEDAGAAGSLGGSLDYDAYLRGVGSQGVNYDFVSLADFGRGWFGRFWGVFQRANLPLGAVVERLVSIDHRLGASVYWNVRRAARRLWAGFGKYHNSGTLFVSDAAVMLRLFDFYAAGGDTGGGSALFD